MLFSIKALKDPGHLINGLPAATTESNLTVPVPIEWKYSGVPQAIREINIRALTSDLKSKFEMSGISVFIPKDTEIAILRDCSEQVNECSVWIKFCSETFLTIGHKNKMVPKGYQLSGLVPVTVNGNPMLYIENPGESSLQLTLEEGQTEVLSILDCFAI